MQVDDTAEAARLAALDSYQILDTDIEACYEQALRLAGALFGTPLAVLAFVDATREWRKAALGTLAPEVERAASLAACVVESEGELVLSDSDEGQPAVRARAAGWRFYAAMPLVSPDGFVLGALAVMDSAPRTPPRAQLDGLRTLAQLVMAQLELRRRRHDEAQVEARHDLRFRQLADAMPHIVWSATSGGEIDYANRAVYDYAGIGESGDIAVHWSDVLHPDDVADTLAAWGESVRSGTVFSAEYRVRRADGAFRWHLAKGLPIRDAGGAIVKWYGTTVDIHDMKLAHEQIGRLAFYDTLTQLPNRQLLMDRLAHAATLHARIRRYGAVLLIDLDHFKLINDTLGHDKGDQLLVQVAQRLAGSVAARDTVSRMGGDEFVMVLEDIGDSEAHAAAHAAEVARRVLAALKGSFNLGGYERNITPSVGVTLFDGEGAGITELLKRADLAMYQAKEAGRDTFRFFDPAIQAAALARAGLEAELRQALQRGQFLLHYQPQQGSDGAVSGVEALLRWRHPERGMVSPAEFIPLAEDTGLILPLGRWVLEQACTQLVEMGACAGSTHLNVSVNVSALQFRQPGFVADVLAVLERSGADACRLKIELTESMLVEDMDGAIEKMALLKRHGVCFALDDFGTGYSSLAYLKRMPLDELKIDQSFVRNLHSGSRDLAIVHTIVALGRSLDMAVIAEGVETLEQRALLADCGCRCYQGYLYSRPLAAPQLAVFLGCAPQP